MFTDQERYVKYMQVTSDVVCYVLLYVIFVPVTMAVRIDCSTLFQYHAGLADGICIYKSIPYLGTILIFIFLSLIASMASVIIVRVTTAQIYTTIVIPLSLGLLNAILLWLLLEDMAVSPAHIPWICGISAFILFLSIVFSRLNIRLLLMKGKAHPFLITTVALAGTGEESRNMARYIISHPETGLRFAGFITTGILARQKNKAIKILGNVTDLPEVAHKHGIGMIMIPAREYLNGETTLLFRTCATIGIELSCFEKLAGVESPWPPVQDEINGRPIFRYKFVKIAPRSAFLKRIFDLTGSGLLIFLCLPLWIVVPLMIKSSSKGPIFFRQERVGKYGRKFILYKFRSMHKDAEAMQERVQHLNEMDGPAFKIKEDPRQTSVGRILRKYSLDELPQLFNVFKGDISLVGPRPAIEDEVAQYRPAELRRLSVVQGITCVWQVSGRNDIKFDEWMKLDLMYIDCWSSVSDFKILFKTIPAVLMKRGAY